MFFAAFPPEFNSGRMYAGPGSDSMLAAAAAWDGLATDLQSAAASYSSVISALASGPWIGPSSLSMVAAITPYVSWMQQTAAQAHEAASQATAAASAYEAAFAAHVPPPVIAANRAQLASLVSTNVFGQNTAAIAATEAQYAEMWAQDALAMDTYAASSAAASKLTPFTAPPQTTSPGGAANQGAAVAQAAGSAAGTGAQSLASTAAYAGSPLLQWLADLSTDYTDTMNGLLNSLFGPSGASTITALYTAIKTPLGFTTAFNDIGLLVNLPVSQFLKFAPAPGFGLPPVDGLGGGLAGPWWGRGWLSGAVSANMGNAGTLVGKLSVPPTWATATPAIRTVAAALSAAGPQTVPAAALGEGALLSSASAAGMLGSAVGAGAPSALSSTGVRARLAPFKDLKDRHTPEQLKQLVAQISDKPESVQHHSVDQDGLDSLLEQLSKKPGIHAVHLTKGGKGRVVQPDARLG
ncbi:PPE family protein PPE33 [Mycobacterium tuberculosis H37Rv] [Mycobacterium shimoidei]|uniref:PPE family protein PPE33 [Mycobacterium tuberculosis H37Rv] n=1 Tax=Mycobacterium shimoidei TaxID=29313 RepID=A0A375Z2B0_MYCSH|nr:PPE family protein [Mycobacterium shimoidei]SRX95236.1 PPE family protein PPE33 [Mycobacterium tuberculosis H37Rv] [Mycobacterium shimoidei]